MELSKEFPVAVLCRLMNVNRSGFYKWKKRLEHPFFGYTFPGESVYQAVISYYKRRYDFDVKKEWILFNHGVNTGNNIAARALGGTIMVATPMYPILTRNCPRKRESR